VKMVAGKRDRLPSYQEVVGWPKTECYSGSMTFLLDEGCLALTNTQTHGRAQPHTLAHMRAQPHILHPPPPQSGPWPIERKASVRVMFDSRGENVSDQAPERQYHDRAGQLHLFVVMGRVGMRELGEGSRESVGRGGTDHQRIRAGGRGRRSGWRVGTYGAGGLPTPGCLGCEWGRRHTHPPTHRPRWSKWMTEGG